MTLGLAWYLLGRANWGQVAGTVSRIPPVAIAAAFAVRDARLARDGILDQGAIARLVGEHQSGRYDHGNRLWLLLNSEVWYRMYIHGASADDISSEIAACGNAPMRRVTAVPAAM